MKAVKVKKKKARKNRSPATSSNDTEATAQHRAFTLNCKEYTGLVIDSIIQSMYDPSTCPFPYYLNWSNSTATVGW